MAATDPGSARTEAERLVATALAAVRLGTTGRAGGFGPLGDLITGVLGHSGDTSPPRPSTPHPAPPGTGTPGAGSTTGGFATGSAECCVCPICRTITALRDPSPEFAERLATGAGDFAAGLASLLRALSTAPDPSAASNPAAAPDPAAAAEPTGHPASTDAGASVPTAAGADTPPTVDPVPPPPPRTSAHPGVRSPRQDPGDDVWRGATRTRHDSWPAPERDVWAAATRAAPDTPPDRADPSADGVGSTGATVRPAPTRSPGAGPVAGADGTSPVVPAARVPGQPAHADGDAGDGA